MATQIQYGDWKTDNIDLSMPRGDTRKYTFTHELGASSAVKEVRFQIRNTAGTALVSISLDSHPTQVDLTESGKCTITISHANTIGVALGSHTHALEMVNQSDLFYTPWSGTFALFDDIVNDDETAAHLSWSTRTTLDAGIDTYEAYVNGMASASDMSPLASAASLGAGTVTVSNGAIFIATDIARIMLDDGTYDDEVLTDVTNNVLTLTGTLTSAAAAGNIVRKVV